MTRLLCIISVYLWMFIFKVMSDDYVIPNPNDELLYTTSEDQTLGRILKQVDLQLSIFLEQLKLALKLIIQNILRILFPRQLAVVNSSTNVGVVIDSEGERLVLLNGETGMGVVIDKQSGIGVDIERGGWVMYEKSLQDYLKDCNISELVERNSDAVFQLEEQVANSHPVQIVQGILALLSTDILSAVLGLGNILVGVIKIFGLVMYPINLLGPILNMITPMWTVFIGGFMGLLNIFKWMGKLISCITGGLPLLLTNAIRFSLSAILSALSGVKVFFVILKVLAMSFDLMSILRPILGFASQIVKFIVGLGGQMLRGLTGVFGVVSELFSFSLKTITIAIKSITGILLNFLNCGPPSYANVGESVSELLTIPQDQSARYGNEQDFEEYNKFLNAFKGDGDYKIQGVSVGPFVQAITKTATSAKAIVVNVMGQLSPIAPLNETMPQLLVNLVKSLNSTEGHSYVQQILPSVKIPQEGMEDVNRDIAGKILGSSSSGQSLDELRSLPAPELLKQLPVVGQIYEELDEAAIRYHNTSLESLLQHHHRAELVEFTTKALGLVQ